jgi:hypothetical protein
MRLTIPWGMNQPCCLHIRRNMNSKTVKENSISSIFGAASNFKFINRFSSQIAMSCGHFKGQIWALLCLSSLYSRRVERTFMCMCMTVTVFRDCDSMYLDKQLPKFRGKPCCLNRRFRDVTTQKRAALIDTAGRYWSLTHAYGVSVLLGRKHFCGI